MRNALFILVLLALTGLCIADVQISGSSVSPSTLRPGLTGSVSFTITNTDASSISGLALYPSGYGLEFSSDSISVGKIGASGSTPVNIPFKVKSNIESGVYNLRIAAYWNLDSIAGGTGYKLIQIPITVSKQTIFQVSSVPKTVGVGEDFTIDAKIKNTGGKASNVVMVISSQYFVMKDNYQLLLGDIDAGQSVDVNVRVSTNLSMPAGVHTVPVTITYQDELGSLQQTTATLGTVQAVKGFVDFSMNVSSDVPAGPGKTIRMMLKIKNEGSITANSVKCSLATSSAEFLPLGPSEKFLGDIKAGGVVTVGYDVGVSSSSAPGYYPLIVKLDYLNKQGEAQAAITKNVGMEVSGTPKLALITSTNPSPVVPGKKYSLSIQVTNVGTTDVKMLRVEIAGDKLTVLDSPESFIGTIKADDYSEVSYNVLVDDDTKLGQLPVQVKLTFRDPFNNEQEIMQTTYVEVVSDETASTAKNGGAGGMDATTIFIVLVVVAVIAYFAYKRFFKKKKA